MSHFKASNELHVDRHFVLLGKIHDRVITVCFRTSPRR